MKTFLFEYPFYMQLLSFWNIGLHIQKQIWGFNTCEVIDSILLNSLNKRSQLQNLLTMVEEFGMLHFFLTSTTYEMASTKWLEFNDMEYLLK
jgi:hypothetical protein